MDLELGTDRGQRVENGSVGSGHWSGVKSLTMSGSHEFAPKYDKIVAKKKKMFLDFLNKTPAPTAVEVEEYSKTLGITKDMIDETILITYEDQLRWMLKEKKSAPATIRMTKPIKTQEEKELKMLEYETGLTSKQINTMISRSGKTLKQMTKFFGCSSYEEFLKRTSEV